MDCCSKLVRDPIELDLENIKGDDAFEISVLFLKLTLFPKINEISEDIYVKTLVTILLMILIHVLSSKMIGIIKIIRMKYNCTQFCPIS